MSRIPTRELLWCWPLLNFFRPPLSLYLSKKLDDSKKFTSSMPNWIIQQFCSITYMTNKVLSHECWASNLYQKCDLLHSALGGTHVIRWLSINWKYVHYLYHHWYKRILQNTYTLWSKMSNHIRKLNLGLYCLDMRFYPYHWPSYISRIPKKLQKANEGFES